MAEQFVGQIITVSFNFAPVGWFLCDGSLKPIDQYQPLYTLLQTTYGGNGSTTFGLPDLRSRVPLSFGTGPGLSPYTQGQTVGTEQVTLFSANTPLHSHDISFSASDATEVAPKGSLTVGANSQALLPGFYASGPGTQPLMGGTIGPNKGGGGLPHENRQPFLALNYIISWAGIFPSRG